MRPEGLGCILDDEQPGRWLDAGDDLCKRWLEGRIAAMHDDIGIHIASDILRRQMIERIRQVEAVVICQWSRKDSRRDSFEMGFALDRPSAEFTALVAEQAPQRRKLY